jgi:hypothetical protein
MIKPEALASASRVRRAQTDLARDDVTDLKNSGCSFGEV